MPIGRPAKPSPLNYRAKLHNLFQNHGSLRYDFVENYSNSQPIFKCTITCMRDGKTITADSGSFYPRKDDAKEMAAYRVLSALKEAIQSRGVSAPASDVSWKSKLKEHYDKQGKAGMELKYTMKEETGCFVSSVFIPELGRYVEGQSGRSKKEAMQNAAQRAMQLLYNSL